VTKHREWPNNPRESRDRAAEYLQEGIRLLTPLVTDEVQFDRTETLRRQAMTLDAMQRAIRFLEAAGAQTRPE
jgi:hypothetical protein